MLCCFVLAWILCSSVLNYSIFPSTNKHFNSPRFRCGWVKSDPVTICFNDEENLKKTCVHYKSVNRKALSGNLHAWQKCVNFQDAFDQLGRKNIGVRLPVYWESKRYYILESLSAQKQFNLVSPTPFYQNCFFLTYAPPRTRIPFQAWSSPLPIMYLTFVIFISRVTTHSTLKRPMPLLIKRVPP